MPGVRGGRPSPLVSVPRKHGTPPCILIREHHQRVRSIHDNIVGKLTRRMVMATRPTFLTTRFGGYFHRDVPTEEAELTHVGPGTPCGEYLRRYWQPVCFTDELQDLPLRVTILGEELVVFRDLSGAVGLLELRCPHRGTSLEYGLIGARGIRCCYHAWLFDVDGTILETPGEPADSTLKDRLCHWRLPHP